MAQIRPGGQLTTRPGNAQQRPRIRAAFAGNPLALEAFDSLPTHLATNGVDSEKGKAHPGTIVDARSGHGRKHELRGRIRSGDGTRPRPPKESRAAAEYFPAQ